jgi:chitodextrinase
VTGYRVERCQGAGCSSFAEISQPSGTTFSDTGRSPSTSYSYRVRAIDAAGNLGPYSSTATATTPAATDAQPPSAPTGLSASAVSSARIDLSWSAATDNVAVTGYRVERCQGAGCSTFAEISQPSGTTFSDTGRSPSTSYSYRVRAMDAAGNLGPYSSTATATTPAATGGLLAAYAFNEASGSSAGDASGGGLTGTLTNGAGWGVGRNSGGLSLDGSNDYVELGNPAALQLTGSMTVSAWVNPTAFPRDDAAIVSKRTSSKIGYQLDTTVDRGTRTVGFKLTSSTGGTMFRYGATTLQAGTWYFVTGVYDAATSQMHVYVNGQLDDGVLLGTVTASQQNSTANVNIGRRPGSNNFNFNGRIDDVRIYNRALTAADVLADMNTPVG